MNDRSIATAAGAIALASAVALDPAGWFPFAVAKWAAVLLAVLVAGAVTFWVRLALPRHPTMMLLAALAALGTVAALVEGVDRASWVGTPIRHLGALAWWVMLLALLVGLAIGHSDDAVVRVSAILAVAAGLVGAYAVVEGAAGAPIGWTRSPIGWAATYGSAAYLGAACTLFVPVSWGVAVDARRSQWWRAAGLSAGLTSTVALIGSGSRAAFVGLGVAAIAVASRRRPVRVLAPVGAAIAVAWIGGAFDRTVGAASRLDEWRVAARAIADSPALGVGPEGYRLVVDRHLDAGLRRSVWRCRQHRSSAQRRARCRALDGSRRSRRVCRAGTRHRRRCMECHTR